jgi:hypothetical protein
MENLITQLPVLGPFLSQHTKGKNGPNSDLIIFGGFVRWFYEKEQQEASKQSSCLTKPTLDHFLQGGSDVDVFVQGVDLFVKLIQAAGDDCVIEYSSCGYEKAIANWVLMKIDHPDRYPFGCYFIYVPIKEESSLPSSSAPLSSLSDSQDKNEEESPLPSSSALSSSPSSPPPTPTKWFKFDVTYGKGRAKRDCFKRTDFSVNRLSYPQYHPKKSHQECPP